MFSKLSDKTRGNLTLALGLLVILVNILGHIDREYQKERAFGITYFFDDIREAETIVVYDNLQNVVARYSNKDIDNLISKYSMSDPNIYMPQRSGTYRKYLKKHVGELLYTVEVIFPKNRNDNKADRDIIKGDTTEVLTIYALNTESFKGDNDYKEYCNNINGQTCVVFLRKALLGSTFGVCK